MKKEKKHVSIHKALCCLSYIMALNKLSYRLTTAKATPSNKCRAFIKKNIQKYKTHLQIMSSKYQVYFEFLHETRTAISTENTTTTAYISFIINRVEPQQFLNRSCNTLKCQYSRVLNLNLSLRART